MAEFHLWHFWMRLLDWWVSSLGFLTNEREFCGMMLRLCTMLWVWDWSIQTKNRNDWTSVYISNGKYYLSSRKWSYETRIFSCPMDFQACIKIPTNWSIASPPSVLRMISWSNFHCAHWLRFLTIISSNDWASWQRRGGMNSNIADNFWTIASRKVLN
jgi:hypothetical protein